MKRFFIALLAFLFSAFLFNGAAGAQSEKQTPDRPLKITEKIPPRIDAYGKCFENDKRRKPLFVRLQITFHASGKVGVEIAEPSGCAYFDKEAVRAAKKIKFQPEIKNGETVTVKKIINYSSSKM